MSRHSTVAFPSDLSGRRRPLVLEKNLQFYYPSTVAPGNFSASLNSIHRLADQVHSIASDITEIKSSLRSQSLNQLVESRPVLVDASVSAKPATFDHIVGDDEPSSTEPSITEPFRISVLLSNNPPTNMNQSIDELDELVERTPVSRPRLSLQSIPSSIADELAPDSFGPPDLNKPMIYPTKDVIESPRSLLLALLPEDQVKSQDGSVSPRKRVTLDVSPSRPSAVFLAIWAAKKIQRVYRKYGRRRDRKTIDLLLGL